MTSSRLDGGTRVVLGLAVHTTQVVGFPLQAGRHADGIAEAFGETSLAEALRKRSIPYRSSARPVLPTRSQ
jgi:hypothetical protein